MAGYDFMFYESFLGIIHQITEIYSKDEAETFCLELIYYGVRRERKETMRPELEAVMRSIYPLIEKSKEHKDQTVKAMKRGFKDARPGQSTGQAKSG